MKASVSFLAAYKDTAVGNFSRGKVTVKSSHDRILHCASLMKYWTANAPDYRDVYLTINRAATCDACGTRQLIMGDKNISALYILAPTRSRKQQDVYTTSFAAQTTCRRE